MAYESSRSHIFDAAANKCVLISVQFDIIRNGLIDELAARAVLHLGKRIERFELSTIRTKPNDLPHAFHIKTK